MSEQILLLNPRHKHKRRTNRRRRSRGGRQPAGLARYWAQMRGTNPRRKHKRRTNRRRTKHSRRTNPRHHHVMRAGRHYRARRTNRRRTRHSRRTNPRFLPSGMTRGIVGGYVVPAVLGGAGALGLDLAWGYLSPHLPAQLQSGWFGMFVKSALVITGAYGLGRVMPRRQRFIHMAGVGAVTVLAATAIKGAAQSVLPATTPGLSGYIDYQSYALPGAGRLHGYMNTPRTLGSLEDLYSPAAVIQPPGTPVPRQFGGLRGYIAAQPHMSAGGGLMGFDWQNDGM